MSDIQNLLDRTSRTFALAIPLLETPPRHEVSVSYLLFRIADTFEDATRWSRQRRLDALGAFTQLLRNPEHYGAHALGRAWRDERPSDDEGTLELLEELDGVVRELDGFSSVRRRLIVQHVARTAEGMTEFVRRADEDGGLKLVDAQDLQRYCYVVAGIVGELLTELFIESAPHLEAVRPELMERQAAFGEGLQLVNILKDADADALEGRSYLPSSMDRENVFAIAKADLRAASEYVLLLQRANAPRGTVEFTALPVLLAHAALEQVERYGPGSKVSRARVSELLGKLRCDVDDGLPVLPTPSVPSVPRPNAPR